MFSQLFLSTLKHVSMVTILEFISFLEFFLEVLFFILWLVILVCFSGLKEIVMLWNVLCMKIYEIKLSLFFRVQAIIILFDHQHVDIMFVCFFQITMMMTMTKQKFFKGSKVSFFSTEAKFDVFKKWVNYTQITKNSNLSFHFRIVLFFIQGLLFF